MADDLIKSLEEYIRSEELKREEMRDNARTLVELVKVHYDEALVQDFNAQQSLAISLSLVSFLLNANK